MKQLMYHIAFFLLLGNMTLAAQPKQEYTEFQVYATTLYLKFNEASLAEKNDFSQLNPEWIKQVKTYLKVMQDSTDGVFIPEIEELGIEVIFQNQAEEEAWAASVEIQSMLRKYGLDTPVKGKNYYYGGRTSLTYKSKKMLNWALIQAELYNKLRYHATLYSVLAEIVENPLWDYYESKPCAGSCLRKLFYWEKARIVYGERVSGDSDLHGPDWSDIYDITKGTIRRSKPSAPAYSFYEEWEPQLGCISAGILVSRHFFFNEFF